MKSVAMTANGNYGGDIRAVPKISGQYVKRGLLAVHPLK
jgi:hypothetical protein